MTKNNQKSAYDCVHVGLHKCASTFLQKIVFPNHPDIGLVRFNTLALNDVSSAMHAMDCTWNTNESRRLLNQAASKVQVTGKKCIVFSDERLSGDVFTGRNSQSKADILHDVIGQTKIMIVLRNPLGYMLSVWRDYVRWGGVLSLKNFLTHWNSSPAYASRFHSIFNKVQYDCYVSHLYKVFGKDRVGVFFLEDLQNHFADFVASVYAFLDVQYIAIPENIAENPGIGYYQANLLRFFNLFCKGRYNQAPVFLLPESCQWKARSLMQRTSKSRKSFLSQTSPELVKKVLLAAEIEEKTCDEIIKNSPIIDTIKDSNRKLADLVGRDLGKLGYDF